MITVMYHFIVIRFPLLKSREVCAPKWGGVLSEIIAIKMVASQLYVMANYSIVAANDFRVPKVYLFKELLCTILKLWILCRCEIIYC